MKSLFIYSLACFLMVLSFMEIMMVGMMFAHSIAPGVVRSFVGVVTGFGAMTASRQCANVTLGALRANVRS